MAYTRLHLQLYYSSVQLLALYVAEQRLDSIFFKAFLFYNIWIYSPHCEDKLRTAFLYMIYIFFLYTASQAPHDDKTLHKARCNSPHLSRNQ